MTLTTEVIVCTYHGADFVVEQLESIIRQTVMVNRISVYDDQSSDDTVARIYEFVEGLPFNEQRLFSIEINERNLGYARNFVSAIGRATHDILFLCDQDDIWELRKVERFLNLFREHNPDMVFSDGCLIDEYGRKLSHVTVLQSYGLSKAHRSHFRDDAFQLLMKQNYINGAAAAVRRTAAQAALPLPCEMAHDYWLAIWCSLHAGVVATPEALYRYRQHDRNVFGIGSSNLVYRWLGIWRQPDAPREQELMIWKAVTDRIRALPCTQEIEAARHKLHWLYRVVPCEKKRLTRALAILKSALDRSYRKYSGSDSLLRDVVSLIK